MLLSVVIPTFRKPELLARTLASLADQELPADLPWELVIVDDGSDDGRTPAVIEAAATALRVVAAGGGHNEGRARARNRGWRAASGRWVLFLDDDIVLRPGALAAHLDAQREREGAYLGTVFTAPEIVDSPLFAYLDSRGVAKCTGRGEVPARYLLTQNVSIPRAALERVAGFDEDFGAYGFEDMEIAFRLQDHAGVRFFALPEAVGEHVHHHTLAEYLQKKRICGEQTLPQLARSHPHRMAEMKLDLLPGLRQGAAFPRRSLGWLLEVSWRLGGTSLARWLLDQHRMRLAASFRHRLYDYLVLASYAEGLRRSRTAATMAH